MLNLREWRKYEYMSTVSHSDIIGKYSLTFCYGSFVFFLFQDSVNFKFQMFIIISDKLMIFLIDVRTFFSRL